MVTTEKRLLREIADWFDESHDRESDGLCSSCGLTWPCPPAKILAYLDPSSQCAYCYQPAQWRHDVALICEKHRRLFALAKNDLTPWPEQLALIAEADA